MCNEGNIIALLVGIGIFIVGAIASIGVAIALNASFWLAPGTPVPLGVAAGLTAAAVASLSGLRPLINRYNECMLRAGEGPDCEGALSNLLNAIAALITVLSIQAAACLATLGISWIPWVGTPAMSIIAGALVLQVPLIANLLILYRNLTNCLRGRISSDEPMW